MKSIKRKGMAFILAMLLALVFAGLPASTEVQALLEDFSDVTKTAWFYDYVIFLAERSIVKGYGDSGEFRPKNPIIREHTAKMVVLGAGLSYQGKKANFPDVDKDGEMSAYIAALVETGAVKGFPDGTFRPQDKIKRSHAAKIIQGALGLKAGTITVRIGSSTL